MPRSRCSTTGAPFLVLHPLPTAGKSGAKPGNARVICTGRQRRRYSGRLRPAPLTIHASILWSDRWLVTEVASIWRVRGRHCPVYGVQTLILGHRGAPARAPENTLRAFRLAADLGADGVEADVQRCADGRLPLIHDDLVDRTTNGSGRVGDLHWSELSRLDAGEAEAIPLLDELLAFAATRPGFFLDLELKMPGVGPDTLAALKRARYTGPVALSSFDYVSLVEARRLDATVELWLLAGEFEPALLVRAREIGARCLALEHRALAPEVVVATAAAGLGAVAWTVNETASVEHCLALEPPLRALITNYPDRAVAIRSARDVATRGTKVERRAARHGAMGPEN